MAIALGKGKTKNLFLLRQLQMSVGFFLVRDYDARVGDQQEIGPGSRGTLRTYSSVRLPAGALRTTKDFPVQAKVSFQRPSHDSWCEDAVA